jgi:quinol monooxygenase YgiN
MSAIALAAVRPTDEHRAEVIAALEEAIEEIHANYDACELYAMMENEDRLVMISKWESSEALAAYAEGDELKKLRAATDGKFKSDPDLQFLTPHPIGDSGKGEV